MRSRVYETVERLSVLLSVLSIDRAACSGFAAERPAGRKYRSTAARRACSRCVVQQAPTLSSKWRSAAIAESVMLTDDV